MSGGALIVVAACLLLLPGILRPGAAAALRGRARPEIHGLLRVLAALNRLYCRVWHQLRTDRRTTIPEKGPAILIANHTCGIDHLLLQATSDRLLGFMVAREYYDWIWIHWICRYIGCIPVNRDGRDLAATRAAIKSLKDGRVLPIFPEGHIVPESGRRIDAIKDGSAYLAIYARVPVIPAYICGTPETNVISRSILTPSKARVLYGEPIDLSEMRDGRPGDKAMQAKVSERFRNALLDLQARAFQVEE
jgi:1-acyl-sn-glycerol-3-phosphate acyltransferase